MLSLNHFYDESGPDHSCQRQDPIFMHDPRTLRPLSFSPRVPDSPTPTVINVVYFLHATYPPLKMPSGESYSARSHRALQALARNDHPRSLPDLIHHSALSRIQFLSLNRDVLSTISSFCPVSDALQLALTCKDAYDFTMPRILADVSIGDPGEDDGPDRLEAFCHFMLAAPHARMKHLRALRLLDGAFARPSNAGGRNGWGADYSPADSLAQLLRQATNLRVIHIRDAEPLFQADPAVQEALSQLSNLKELSLYYIGNSTLRAIAQLRSRPAVIENGLWKDGPRPQGDITPFGPYVSSLEHLKLWECGCMLESIVDKYVWPNVHTLDIGGRIAKISELAHAFPNLQRLTFFLEFSVKQETGPAVCWPELDYLETSAPIPSFPSPVRRLQIQYPIGTTMGTQNDLKTLPLMEKTNPVVLSCTISHKVPETMLERMKGCMPSLRYMELIVNDSGSRSTINWQSFQDWVERNLEIMRTTSIVGLCIAFAGPSMSPANGDARRRITNIARMLTRTIKTLEYVGVGQHDSIAPMYEVDCEWFRVASRPADDAHAPSLDSLSRSEGERVRAYLLDTPRE
ncbi:hypothetical protein C8Q80DRAFT_1271491 [Daedaleopsis nitida]|nr:hypothetical protein C8Q80DRAFT_1271491 [Daedaleopsis nitida]